jgi:dTDP-4-amino-4,6-dideoxygalactose transaminase
MDEDLVEELITPNTKAIICVHYAGVACDMDKLMALAKKYGIFVVEDAAQAIESFYKGKPLGSIGHLATFSFHETKNIICGEGGLLAINDERFAERAEIIWEKGTNRSKFFRGEIDKYGWVDTGSSFLPSELCAAFLWAQLEKLEEIQQKRIDWWDNYYSHLKGFDSLSKLLPYYASNNAHMYYLVLDTLEIRSVFISGLRKIGIHTVFHYQALHESDYYLNLHDGRELFGAKFYTNCLVRLPLFCGMTKQNVETVANAVKNFSKTC